MEENLPKEEIKIEQRQNRKFWKDRKKLYALLGGGLLIVVAIISITFLIPKVTTPQSETDVAPKGESLLNPLDFQASILFSTLYLEAKPGDKIKNDIDLMTFSDGSISGGTIVINYDSSLISNIKVTPVSGSTSLLPDVTFTDVQYNPTNVTFSFETPAGTVPATGRGRIAEIEFTINKNANANPYFMVDLDRSSLYSAYSGASTKLRTGSSNMDINLGFK